MDDDDESRYRLQPNKHGGDGDGETDGDRDVEKESEGDDESVVDTVVDSVGDNDLEAVEFDSSEQIAMNEQHNKKHTGAQSFNENTDL